MAQFRLDGDVMALSYLLLLLFLFLLARLCDRFVELVCDVDYHITINAIHLNGPKIAYNNLLPISIDYAVPGL